MRAARFCGSEGLEVSGWRGPGRARCPSRLLARFPVRAVPPPALGQRAELSVSAVGRAGARGQRRPERGERVGRGPAAALQAPAPDPNLPRGCSLHHPSAPVILQSLLLVKPAPISTVSTQQFCLSVSKILFSRSIYLFVCFEASATRGNL